MDNDQDRAATERAHNIRALLAALESSWTYLSAELERREKHLVAELIDKNNEQTRGRIWEVQTLRDLPGTLAKELTQIEAALRQPELDLVNPLDPGAEHVPLDSG